MIALTIGKEKTSNRAGLLRKKEFERLFPPSIPIVRAQYRNFNRENDQPSFSLINFPPSRPRSNDQDTVNVRSEERSSPRSDSLPPSSSRFIRGKRSFTSLRRYLSVNTLIRVETDRKGIGRV